MTQQVLQKCAVKKCPNIATKKITYECGTMPDETLTLCDDYIDHDEIFGRFIKSIEPIVVIQGGGGGTLVD